MKVKATKNSIDDLPEKLRGFAFNQDESGRIDITIGNLYDVYGVQEHSLGKFYLVLTDEINDDMPWWMPAVLYAVDNPKHPDTWVTKEEKSHYGENSRTSSYPIYFGSEEDIEDGTEKGFEVFAKMQEYLRKAADKSLQEDNMQCLYNIVNSKNPSDTGLIDKMRDKTISQNERQRLIDFVGHEFSEKGLGADDESNAYGYQLEALIDMINQK